MDKRTDSNATRRTTRSWKATARAVALLSAVSLGATEAAFAQGNYRQQAAAEARLRALVAQLNDLNAQALAQRPQVQLPNGCPRFAGELLAPNVRVSIPVNPICRTREERAYHDRVTAAIITGEIIRTRKHGCEMRRSSQPYTASWIGRDGIRYHRLNDGSVHRQGGRLNPGWYETFAGPMMTACQ